MAGSAASQDIPIDIADASRETFGYQRAWDSVRDEVIFYRNTTNPEHAAIHRLTLAGDNLAIYPLREFPEARTLTVWDAAATPDGGVIFSATVSYGEPGKPKPSVVRSFLLTYDRAGHLVKLWDVTPYQHFRVAVDHRGNVYAFGVGDSDDPRYPLLIKYSPDGEVARELFPANTYTAGDSIVTAPSRRGQNRLFVQGNSLYLWLAGPMDLWTYSLDGQLVGKTSYASTLRSTAKAVSNDDEPRMIQVGVQSGRIVIQTVIAPSAQDKEPQPMMVVATADGTQSYLLNQFGPLPQPTSFLGVSSAGKLVFLKPTSRTTATVMLCKGEKDCLSWNPTQAQL